GSRQSYVEDCPVCCNPNVIHVELDEDEAYVRSEPEQDR
ncbi:MAG: CPXCG motif-containing cysteine-rich protein, partial [Planctomycetota bacterium]|nr:CPXCG motif-containing cysteine-rich protein [Planctomycetota bacterium]